MRAEVDHGRLTLADARGEVLAGSGEVLLTSGRVISTCDDHAPLRWLIDDQLIRLAYRNDTRAPIQVEQLRPLVAPRGAAGARVRDLHISSTGWQSWSRANPPISFAPNMHTAGPPIRGPYLPHRGSASQVEAWMTLLRLPDRPSILLGFVSAEEQLGTIEIAPTAGGGHTLMAATELEGIVLAPGDELVSEPLLIASGEESELSALYAQAVAEAMRPRPRNEILTGWCSWYQLYTTVSEQDVRRNLANLVERRDLLPGGLIQLDDGFQYAVGDWLEVNDKFPSGMPGLVGDIRQQGFVPGLWLAPFLLSANSHTFAAHPDWVVRDDAGQPLNALFNWGAANYVLDTTQPGALDYIRHAVHTATREWGYAYLKLDFLYAAALRGRRHDPTLTSVQVYRRALRAMRDVAGDRFILASGAPLLPSVGLVDGMRIGSDVAAEWGRDGHSDGPALSNAMRATLARGWFHGRWWTNDPDCVIVRAHDTELSLDEVRAWAAVVALSGGMLFVGDDVSEVEPDRLELLSRLLPPSGHAAEVAPRVVDRMPQRLHLRIERAWATWSVIGIGNWSDNAVTAAFEPAEWGLPAAVYHVFDLWSGEYLGRHQRLSLGRLAAHALRLLSVHPDLGRPQTVGSTGHLLGPAMDLADEHWEPASGALLLTPSASGPAARRGEFVVATTGGRVRRVPFARTGPGAISVTMP
jgi:alpha-galactosidase